MLKTLGLGVLFRRRQVGRWGKELLRKRGRDDSRRRQEGGHGMGPLDHG